MFAWWRKLDPGDQAALVGGLAVGVGLVGASVVTARLVASGVDVRMELEPATRNLVSSSVREVTSSVDRIIENGVPIGMRFGPATPSRVRNKQT
jgi:hypothetical protein